jgi:hypothetical protein
MSWTCALIAPTRGGVSPARALRSPQIRLPMRCPRGADFLGFSGCARPPTLPIAAHTFPCPNALHLLNLCFSRSWPFTALQSLPLQPRRRSVEELGGPLQNSVKPTVGDGIVILLFCTVAILIPLAGAPAPPTFFGSSGSMYRRQGLERLLAEILLQHVAACQAKFQGHRH